MLKLPEFMTWNMFLEQHAKYAINYGQNAIFFYSKRGVINYLHQNRYRWRDVKSLGNGEWETKDKRITIKKVKVTAATNRHKTE
jgi:hypothetical protein